MLCTNPTTNIRTDFSNITSICHNIPRRERFFNSIETNARNQRKVHEDIRLALSNTKPQISKSAVRLQSQPLHQIKSSLYSPYYAKACNELRGPSPRLSAWASQLLRNVATVASRWRYCADLTGPGIEPRPPAPIACA